MTANAVEAPPTEAGDGDDELRRYTPAEVVAKQWLPYKSARVLREKAYKRQVIHHNDSGRITFTLDDIRRENARTTVEALAA